MNDQRLQELRTSHVRHIVDGVQFARVLDMRLVEWEPDRVMLRVPFSSDRTSNGRVFHGGVLSSLADSVGSAAAYSGHVFEEDRRIGLVTVSLSIHYLDATPGADLVAEARCTRRGRQLCYCDIALRDAAGKPLATAMAIYRLFPTRRGE
jgi:uncharacterized protein (TIGR00369 family)